MGDNVVGFRGIPTARRSLARQLRELADIIEADQAETEPHGIMLCLTGAHQHEVIGIGDLEGWVGARNAVNAVLSARFDTVGGNIRMRGHAIYQPKASAEITPLIVRKRDTP